MPAFEVWHYEQADRYGLSGRVAHVTGMGCRPEDFSAAFAGDEAARARMLADFAAMRAAAGRSRADVIIPAGRAAGLLMRASMASRSINAPVVNCAAVALKSAEMWVQLRRLNGTEPRPGASFALANERGRQDFRPPWRHGRQTWLRSANLQKSHSYLTSNVMRRTNGHKQDVSTRCAGEP